MAAMKIQGRIGAQFGSIPRRAGLVKILCARRAEKICENGRWCRNTNSALFLPQPVILLDPNGDRHTETRHAVEDVAADLCLGLLIGQSPGVKTPAEDGFICTSRFQRGSARSIRNSAASHYAPACDRREMLVALCRRTLARNGRGVTLQLIGVFVTYCGAATN